MFSRCMTTKVDTQPWCREPSRGGRPQPAPPLDGPSGRSAGSFPNCIVERCRETHPSLSSICHPGQPQLKYWQVSSHRQLVRRNSRRASIRRAKPTFWFLQRAYGPLLFSLGLSGSSRQSFMSMGSSRSEQDFLGFFCNHFLTDVAPSLVVFRRRAMESAQEHLCIFPGSALTTNSMDGNPVCYGLLQFGIPCRIGTSRSNASQERAENGATQLAPQSSDPSPAPSSLAPCGCGHWSSTLGRRS
jgi:hypothetical protein